jgi:hypothetical protein
MLNTHVSSEAGIIGYSIADATSEFILTQPHEIKKQNKTLL